MHGGKPQSRRGSRGASLVGLLMIVLVLGLLSAAALVGVSSLTDSSNGTDVIAATNVAGTTSTTGVSPVTTGASSAGLGASGSQTTGSSCSASADAAKAASAVYYANSGGVWPDRWAEMTTSTPPTLELPADVGAGASPTEIDGRGWKLTMTGGGANMPTFTCG